jgi:hypothetical protein
MASRKRRSARRRSVDVTRSSTAPLQQTAAAEEAEATGDYTPSDTREGFEFADPVTGGTARADRNPDGSWVLAPWKLVDRSWLFDLAEAIGLRDALALKEDPRKYLAPFITSNVRKPKPEPLPSLGYLHELHKRALADADVMWYLESERGLSTKVIEQALLGYDGRAITKPIFDVKTPDKLVNVKRRYWPHVPIGRDGKPMKYMIRAGSTASVYPFLQDGPLILVAGEFDALVLQSNGLPGISNTAGAATRWRADWTWIVEGRRIAVMYDADTREQDQAISRAAELRRTGAEDAWPVRLTEAGLSDGDDATDWFVKHGRSRADLLSLIKRERAASERRRSR